MQPNNNTNFISSITVAQQLPRESISFRVLIWRRSCVLLFQREADGGGISGGEAPRNLPGTEWLRSRCGDVGGRESVMASLVSQPCEVCETHMQMPPRGRSDEPWLLSAIWPPGAELTFLRAALLVQVQSQHRATQVNLPGFRP